jgi:hypothetical protein
MAHVDCPRCSKQTEEGGFAPWRIAVAIFFFPIGLAALVGAREPTICASCGHSFQR